MNKIKLKEIKCTDIHKGDRFREDLGDIHDLAENVKLKGIITPITVDTNLNLVAGERRLTAAKLAGLTHIPCVIREVDDETDAREIELYENIHRKEMNWDERAKLEYEIYSLKKSIDPKWNKTKQGEMLEITHTSVGRHITLAVAMEVVPELADCKTEEEAWKKWHGIKEELALQELASRINVAAGEAPLKGEEVSSKEPSEEIPSIVGYSADEVADQVAQAALTFAKSAYTVGDTLKLIRKVKAGCCHFAEVDPPYGIKLRGQRGRVQDQHTLEAYNEIPASDYKVFLELAAKGTFEALHENAFCVWWFGPSWYATVRQALISVGFKVAEIPGIWYKGGVGQTNSPETNLANSYEMFFVARKGKPALAKRGRSNVFEFSPVPPKQKVHPTERPIELMEEILGTFTHPGARVIVPFLGSGVTLKAMFKGNLKGFGYDLSEHNRNLYLERVISDSKKVKKIVEDEGDEEHVGRTRKG